MVLFRYNPLLAFSEQGDIARLPVTVNNKEKIKGILIEIKKVKVIKSFYGISILKVVGKEIYFKPLKEVVNERTQRFVDWASKTDKNSLYINAWWELKEAFTDFYAQQHQIDVLDHVTFKTPLFSVLNNL